MENQAYKPTMQMEIQAKRGNYLNHILKVLYWCKNNTLFYNLEPYFYVMEK